jgi:hypothetical protein
LAIAKGIICWHTQYRIYKIYITRLYWDHKTRRMASWLPLPGIYKYVVVVVIDEAQKSTDSPSYDDRR